MAKDAYFSKHDIPYCPTTATRLPNRIVTWEEAKDIYRKSTAKKDYGFTYDAFVCFYIDDYKFDGAKGIWHNSAQALKVLCRFSGVITFYISGFSGTSETVRYIQNEAVWILARKKRNPGNK